MSTEETKTKTMKQFDTREQELKEIEMKRKGPFFVGAKLFNVHFRVNCRYLFTDPPEQWKERLAALQTQYKELKC